MQNNFALVCVCVCVCARVRANTESASALYMCKNTKQEYQHSVLSKRALLGGHTLLFVSHRVELYLL